ncbi:exoribonuclease R [Leucobacter exalbidus]|uniref:Exoribonuclease R n=1 Tax=Leucobacter exalbidus TaxID=662960 RepID=A0A940PUT8_9MICO|nr:RNB domain-containing ribonuclease [Leucobacter exalbidus]MBP1325689.1 exoribonuclease R [Leucobacter exalbidus]
MPHRRSHLSHRDEHGLLESALQALRTANNVPVDFTAAARLEAEAAAVAPPEPPALDLRHIPFVTLDPASSRDLDQAFHLERNGTGWLLRYAIADVPSFVTPGGALDAEARRRGQTLYLPDGSVPLHPRVLSEGRASLLPDEDRTAYVWTIPTDASGRASFEGGQVDAPRVERAQVRSVAKLDYVSAQAGVDAGTPRPEIALLQAFATLRIAEERRRGGASLNMADEEIVCNDGEYRIERSFPLPVEDWNAQLSLLTGMTAACIMLDGGIGIIRTMPPPDAAALAEFRTRVTALGQQWPNALPYGEYLRTINRDTAAGVAVLHAAAGLFRGAGYAVFGVPDANGTMLQPPAHIAQAAIAAPYAHVTAPLRRLVDRWGLVICEALCAGRQVPAWASASLPEIPALMRASASFAGQLGAAALDMVEAALLQEHVGKTIEVTVLEARGSGSRVQITTPPVTARTTGRALTPGTQGRVRVVRADIASGVIELEAA